MYTTRRSLLVALGAAGLATTVGCSSKDSSMAGTESAAPSVSSDAEAVFPATIKHKFGTTTVDKRPERVAVVGYTEQDTVLAFGFKPVLVRNWYGPDKVIQPWAKELAGDLSLTGTDLGTGAIDVEKVAASNPDLIIGSASGMTKADYDKLSKLAPVVAQEAEFIDFGQPWQNTTRQVGIALGQPKKAEELVATLEQKFASTKAANPQWAVKALALATFDGKNQISSFNAQDARTRFFTSLGFTMPPAITAMAGEKFYVQFPLEKASLIDADVLVWDQLSYTAGGKAALAKTPALANLKAMRENRVVHLEPVDVEGAFGWQTILSIPYALDRIAPALQKVLPAK